MQTEADPSRPNSSLSTFTDDLNGTLMTPRVSFFGTAAQHGAYRSQFLPQGLTGTT
jgi:hypothetical protein